MGAASGSTSPITEVVNLYISGTTGSANLNYDISILYTGPAQGWLSASPIQGTTPAKITLTADPTNLAAGTYSAQVLASIGPQHLGAYSLVSFIVAPASSNPGGLSATPASLTFLPGSVTAQTFSVSNAPGGTAPLGFTMFANPTDAFLLSSSSQTTPATISVQPQPGLSPGIHNASVTITTVDGSKSVVVPITISIPSGPTAPTVTLNPDQSALTFNFQLGSTLNPQQGVFVETDSGEPVTYTATASASWLLVAQTSLSILTPPASSATCFAPGFFYVSVDPAGLTAGVYHGTVTLSSPGVASVDIPVTLTVSASPVLNADPSFVFLNSSTNILNAFVSVTASANFQISATVSVGWLSVTPS
jgi:hypothetical protein